MEEDAKRKSEEAARLAREAKLREKEKMQRVSLSWPLIGVRLMRCQDKSWVLRRCLFMILSGWFGRTEWHAMRWEPLGIVRMNCGADDSEGVEINVISPHKMCWVF